MKVTIGIPSGTEWKAKFARDLIVMVGESARAGIDCAISNQRGSLLPQMRRKIVDAAIQRGSSHVLFVDTDQTFPPHTLTQLLSWQKPIVACNVATKSFPSMPTARVADGTKGGGALFTLKGDNGLVRVWRVGTGVMLIDLEVFKKIEKPWFNFGWDKQTKQEMGEDWWFCRQAQAKGYSLFVDQGLSYQIGHIGEHEFTHADIEVAMEIDHVKSTSSARNKSTKRYAERYNGETPPAVSEAPLLAQNPSGGAAVAARAVVGD